MSEAVQEVIALTTVALAAAYLVRRMIGKPKAPVVILGRRLQRGLRRARKSPR